MGKVITGSLGGSMSDTSYNRRKLFSFLGLVPLAIYVVCHLAAQAQSWVGEEHYSRNQEEWHRNPYYWPIVTVLIYFSILYHAAYGLYLSFKGRPNLTTMPFFVNFKYLIQRVTAIGLLLFIPAHVYKTRIEVTMQQGRIWDHMVEGFHEPLTLGIYVLCMLAMAFHIANGFWLGGITWGITISRKSQRAWQALSIGIFVLLSAMAGLAIAGFARVPMVTGHF